MYHENTHVSRIRRGAIVAFDGSWNSGLATLVVLTRKNGHDVLEHIACDNTLTARSLIAAFGCGAPGHTVDNNLIHGRKIRFALDRFGLLAAFMPEGQEN